jgi:protocatechuate 3,4-dioxygenase beta subunit
VRIKGINLLAVLGLFLIVSAPVGGQGVLRLHEPGDTIQPAPKPADGPATRTVPQALPETTGKGSGGARGLSPVPITLFPASPIRSMSDYTHVFQVGRGDWGGTAITSCELEIRDAPGNQTVARVPSRRNRGFARLVPGRNFPPGNDFPGWDEPSEADKRLLESLPDGEYRVALIVNGLRRSNVAPVTVDSAFDPAREPTLKLSALGGPGGGLPYLGIRAIGPTPQDPDLTNAAVAFARVFADGVERKWRAITWTGPVGPLKPGQMDLRILDVGSNLEPPLEPGKTHEIYVKVGKYQSAPITLDLGDPLGKVWDKRPSPPSPAPLLSLIGRVRGTDGAPAKGYRVALESRTSGRFDCRSEARGRYLFFDVPAGPYSLTCTPPDSMTPVFAVERVSPDENQAIVLDINMSLRPELLVAGRVRYEDGAPAGGIQVEADWSVSVKFDGRATSARLTNAALTNEQGDYTLSGPEGVHAYGVRIGRTFGKGRLPYPYNDVDPASASSRAVDFTLRREADQIQTPASFPGTLELRVRAVGSGDPIEGVELACLGDSRLKGATDKEGRCSIALPDHAPAFFTIHATRAGFVPTGTGFGTFGMPDNSLIPSACTIWMERGSTVGGIVKDEAGNPIEGATLKLSGGMREGRYETRSQLETTRLVTDAQGRWTCDFAPSRFYTLQVTFVERPGYVTLTYNDIPHFAPDEFRARTATIVVKKGLVFRGVVQDASGHPIEKANVHLDPIRHGARIEALSDSEGRFQFDHAPFGDAMLTATAPGHAPESKAVVVAEWTKSVTIQLGPPHTIRGRVVDESGRPIANAGVMAQRLHGQPTLTWRGTTDAEGRFVWNEAPESTVEFWISKGTLGRYINLKASAEENTIPFPAQAVRTP